MSTCYQLRKVGLPASVEKVKNLYRLTSSTTIIGRGQTVDIFLDSSIRKGLISRAHAQIIQSNGENGVPVYSIFDTSLNGTYVNDRRVKGSIVLKEGDTVAFGHLCGSKILPGALGPQKETEFLFKFEKCLHPEVKDEPVDLTDKELNNNSSSVFMSPKSPSAENGSLLPGLSHILASDSEPPVKRVKRSLSGSLSYESNDEEITYPEEKIESDDDSSFCVDLDAKVSDVASEEVLSSAPLKLVHPRNKVISLPNKSNNSSNNCSNSNSSNNSNNSKSNSSNNSNDNNDNKNKNSIYTNRSSNDTNRSSNDTNRSSNDNEDNDNNTDSNNNNNNEYNNNHNSNKASNSSINKIDSNNSNNIKSISNKNRRKKSNDFIIQKREKLRGAKGMIGMDRDVSELEVESGSEYMDSDSDSEKSEEIPDESSDNEYTPKVPRLSGKRKNMATLDLDKTSRSSKLQTSLHKVSSDNDSNNKSRNNPKVNVKSTPNSDEVISGAKKTKRPKDYGRPRSINDYKTVIKRDYKKEKSKKGIKKEQVETKEEKVDDDDELNSSGMNGYTHDKCDAPHCKIPSGSLKTITWIQCDNCDAWYHVSCSGLSVSAAKKEDTIFRCGCA